VSESPFFWWFFNRGGGWERRMVKSFLSFTTFWYYWV